MARSVVSASGPACTDQLLYVTTAPHNKGSLSLQLMRVFHFAALAAALLVVSATILYSPSSTYATSTSSTFSSSTTPFAPLSAPWENEGVAFPLPPRWVVLALNRMLYWLQSLRDAFLPPQLRLLELHFKFVHNRALHAAATLGLADVVPPEPDQLVRGACGP